MLECVNRAEKETEREIEREIPIRGCRGTYRGCKTK